MSRAEGPASDAPTGALHPHLVEFLTELFRAQPVFATSMGDHRFDDRWPDMTRAGLDAFAASLRAWTEPAPGVRGLHEAGCQCSSVLP